MDNQGIIPMGSSQVYLPDFAIAEGIIVDEIP